MVSVAHKVSFNKRPYFGMTGTQLNIWVTIACTTAMTLFGALLLPTRPSLSHTGTYGSLGYDQGVFGGIIVTQDFLETMGNPNANLQGTIVSLYDIGWYVVISISPFNSRCVSHSRQLIQAFSEHCLHLFGVLYVVTHHSGHTYPTLAGERLGRKKVLMVGVIVMSIGAILQTSAFSVTHMIVARLITG